MGHKERSASVKTAANTGSVSAYIKASEPKRQADCRALLAMMQTVSNEPPVMWGQNIVGFGRYHYHYASGRQGDWMRIGFSSRKAGLTLYCMSGFGDLQPLLKKLGKVKHSVSCLYLPSFDKLDMSALETLVQRAWAQMAERYPS